MSFSCVKIKRASLERDFYTALFVYNGINLHTVRHKSVLHNISQSQSHHPALLGSQAFHGWCKRILSTEDITHFTSPTQNAMPQASICPEADYLVKKKSAVQYAVG